MLSGWNRSLEKIKMERKLPKFVLREFEVFLPVGKRLFKLLIHLARSTLG